MRIFIVLFLCLTTGMAVAQGPLSKKRPAPSSTQQSNIDKLQSDLAGLQAKSQVTPAMKQQLATDLMAMANGATKPSQAAVDKLAADLSAALADKKITQRELAKLTADLQAVLNSANVSMEEFNAVVSDVKTILTASGVTKSDVQMIVADLQAIGAELKANVPANATVGTKSTAAPPAKKFPRR